MEARKLRPVYDALERSDSAQALRECERLLHKQPNLYGARALKTFILARTGRIVEALGLGQSLLDTPKALESQHVQQGLSLAYRVLNRPEEEIAVYNTALTFAPESEALYCKVFMAAARSRLFKEQHMAAVNLNKLFKDKKYVWWLVISLMLHGKHSGVDSTSSQVQLKLAERMCEKALAEGQLTTSEELRVYLEVLETLGKHEQMIDVLAANDSLAAMVVNDPDLVTQNITLLVKTGSLDKAVDAAVQTLESLDNWADYKLYMDATVLSLERANGDEEAKKAAVSAICANLRRWASVRDRARGAKLALVSLSLRLHGAGYGELANAVVGSPGELIWAYVDEFQQKAICYSDIVQFINAHVRSTSESDLDTAALEFHAESLNARLRDARDASGQGENATQAWVNLEKIRYLLQALRGETDPKAWVADIEQLLEFALTSNAARKKRPSCSDMAVIASQRIIQSAMLAYGDPSKRDELASALFKAACVLEAAIQHNGESFLLRLYSIRVYIYLSCYERAKSNYEVLNIKNIQHDTLGHLLFGQGMALGCFVSDLELCYDGVAFYDQSRSKIPREIEKVYYEGTYSNVKDFLEFQDNLSRSVQHECTHRHALRGEAFEHGSDKGILAKWREADVTSIKHTEKTLNALHDNRDVSVMGLLTPADLTQWNLELLTRATPMPGTGWIQAFSLIPQLMNYMVCADLDAIETALGELATIGSSSKSTLSTQDCVLVRGIIDIMRVYIQASNEKESVDEKLGNLVDSIHALLPSDQFDTEPDTLGMLSSLTIRNASVATELFTYALSLKHALSAQRLAAANTVGSALSQLRKSALKSINLLRGWIDKCVRSQIDEQWLRSDDELYSGITQFMLSRQKQSVDIASKACMMSWLRSVKNLLAQWEQCSL
ncbi:mitochondrial distribution and morphology [Coemansia guatemalensis]|uniref:Mitochondrial distribution and morphology n=1 Tax=Coemansia guatemalensis TaxID=2761395 RepID=A0A9W8HSA1_9FUNG|nr:mitochondrial distribution and morphology [Coemansia guatemalensis]